MDAKQLIDYYDELISERQPYVNLYDQCYDFSLPDKGGIARRYKVGENNHRHIFDYTAEYSVDVMASSMLGILANPATRWVGVEMVDEELNRISSVAQWCDEAGQTLLNYINRPSSSFYKSVKASMLDMVVVGMPATFVQDRAVYGPNETGFDFVSLPPMNLVIDQDINGDVDTFFLLEKKSCKQLYEKRDEWDIHEDVIKAFEDGKRTEKTDVIMAVLPRLKRDPKALDALNMPFACYYIDKERNHIMHETGFNEFPAGIGRWSLRVPEKYPRSPVSVALGEIKNLNEARRQLIISVEKANNPAVWIPNDNTPRKISYGSGGVNFYDATKGAPVFESGVRDVKSLFELVQDFRSTVRTILYNDQLQMVGTQQMTATEVMQRTDERARLIAPNIGAISTDYMSRMLERCLSILIRQGVIDDIPQEIEGQEFRITFNTPLTRAQRSADAEAIGIALQSLGGMLQLAQASGQPSPIDNLDLDRSARELLDIYGVSGVMLRDEDDVALARQVRAEQAQMQQMQQAMGQQANGG